MKAYTLEIYQNPQRNSAYFCKVTLGDAYFEGLLDLRFQASDRSFELPLNGPGRNKAIKKVKKELRHRGLERLVEYSEKKFHPFPKGQSLGKTLK